MLISLLILGIVISLLVLLNFYTRKRISKMPLVADHAKIKKLTNQNFSQQIKKGVVLVDFWAEWCAPCKMMAPVLNELAEETDGKVTIGKLNVDEEKVTANQFRIRGIPTMILFKEGKEIHRFVGVKSKDYLLRELDRRITFRS